MRHTPLALGLALLCASGATAGVQFTVDTQQDVRPISRFVYGVNGALEGGYSNAALTRLGGNRWTAYNWENNASNAGMDYLNQNDSYLSSSDTPGAAVRDAIAAAQARGAAILLTVPINGYVAADKNGGGDVDQTPNYLQLRFEESLASKGAPFTLTPDAGDGFVYQDEFVNWVDHEFPGSAGSAHPIFFSLDNEPDLWPATHPRIHPDATTYAELAAKSIAHATAIKNVSPAALVFGPVNYGWYGYVALQGAPDAAGRDFQEFWLAEIEAAQQLYGARLVDVLDVHWYPEAQGGGVRITGTETAPAVVAARLQAPRSLWDPSYTETSWIAQDSVGGPIALLPRLRDKIDANAPGTKLAVTEYNYGGGQHISGGIAQADVLGVFGREGVFAASEWPLAGDESYIEGAFEMYRNFDGANGRFGDTSVRAGTDDIAGTSIYASVNSSDPERIVVVALNKTAAPIDASIDLANPTPLLGAKVYRLVSTSPSPVAAGDLVPAGGSHLAYTMPAYSVNTLVLAVPEADPAGAAVAIGILLLLRIRRNN
ncbi:MAG: putative Endoglucanase secreted [Deltaproteobacteria bacterium]|nr:putative Endoglucanase secreted [Deltaproteobacteria bacterium]